MGMRWVRLLEEAATAMAVLWAVACGQDSGSASWVAHTDTIGDTVAVHTVAGGLWTRPVQLVEGTVIGVLDGPDEYTFGEVFRLAEDGAGGVYVSDRQSPQLRHYDSTGVFTGNVGRAGEGPGEYSWAILGMAVCLAFLVPVFSLLYGFTGFAVWRAEPEPAVRPAVAAT